MGFITQTIGARKIILSKRNVQILASGRRCCIKAILPLSSIRISKDSGLYYRGTVIKVATKKNNTSKRSSEEEVNNVENNNKEPATERYGLFLDE